MSNESIIKRFRLTQDSIDYISEYAREKNIPQDNRTINMIIDEHRKMTSLEDDKDNLVESISDKISKEINKEISRIRLGTNNTDRNTQILIELLNGFMFHNNVDDIMTTEDGYGTKALDTASELVQRRIENLKQKKDDYNKRRDN